MDCLVIDGGRPLQGSVMASGAKNAALPIMAASLMAQGPVRLARIPRLSDVNTLAGILRGLGVSIDRDRRGTLVLDTPDRGPMEPDPRLVRRLRAGFCVLGPLLARRGRAVAALPGGCRIGERPIDLHLAGLAALGASIRVERGFVVAEARQLRGARVQLTGARGPTVTGTANVLCAATLAQGKSTLVGAAREPEIVDLGRFLKAPGARIEGLGTDCIEVEGVEQLGTTDHEIIPDRIETATLLLAAAITGGDVAVTRVVPAHLATVVDVLHRMGCAVELGPDWIRLRATRRLQAVDIDARPFPGLPTDVQAQFSAVLTLARGQSVVRDGVFPERFAHLAALARCGALIERRPGRAVIEGVARLRGAQVTACDLRASAALVLAGLAAEGQTTVRHVAHLDRGYERLEHKLSDLGAMIERITPAGLQPRRRSSSRGVALAGR